MASRAFIAAGVMATTAALGFDVGLGVDHGDAAAAVVPAHNVAPGQRSHLAATQPPSDNTDTRARSNLAHSAVCSDVSMLPAATGLDGGETYDAEHIGGGAPA